MDMERKRVDRTVMRCWVAAVLLAAVACSKPTDPGNGTPNTDWLTRQVGGVTYTYAEADAALVTAIAPVVATEAGRMTEFLGLAFEGPYGVTVSPDKVTFDARFYRAYFSPAQCWVIATASAAGVELLSPRAWECGHNPSSTEHLRLVLAHELTHVIHAQHPETGFPLLRWFQEGLASYASGQLDAEYRGQAQTRFSQGYVPISLEGMMNDSAAYGLAGDLVRYIDRVWGRATLRLLTRASTTTDAMAVLNESEASLIARWRANALTTSDTRTPCSAVAPPTGAETH
jgi:hypothetical protein